MVGGALADAMPMLADGMVGGVACCCMPNGTGGCCMSGDGIDCCCMAWPGHPGVCGTVNNRCASVEGCDCDGIACDSMSGGVATPNGVQKIGAA